MLRGPLFHRAGGVAGAQAHLPGPSTAGLEQAAVTGHCGEGQGAGRRTPPTPALQDGG